MDESTVPDDPTRRVFVKAVAYVTPAILTLSVTPVWASPGSLKDGGCQTVGGADRFPCIAGAARTIRNQR